MQFRKNKNSGTFVPRYFEALFVFFSTEEREMYVAFRMGLEVNNQTIGRNNGSVYMIIERFIVNQLSERTVHPRGVR